MTLIKFTHRNRAGFLGHQSISPCRSQQTLQSIGIDSDAKNSSCLRCTFFLNKKPCENNAPIYQAMVHSLKFCKPVLEGALLKIPQAQVFPRTTAGNTSTG